MRALTASEELRIWESGNRETLAARSLMLLAAALPNSPPGDLARLPIGRRDGLLLTLRELMFGSRIEGLAACPQCDERLDLMFDVAEIRAANDPEESKSASHHFLKLNGFEVVFRAPDSTDLEAIAECPDADSGREKLLERCAIQVGRENSEADELLSVGELPATVVTALVERMDHVDPQANVKLSLVCPACQHTWEAVFDIASFFWGEITDWAKRMLRQVHVLASSYGWSEKDILEMSAERRSYYVHMIEGM
jgi:uncharacterized protein (UPF0212 family)